MGIEVLPPHGQRVRCVDFTVAADIADPIRPFGDQGGRRRAPSRASSMSRERKDGPFRVAPRALTARAGPASTSTSRVLEALIQAGALDSFAEHRSQLAGGDRSPPWSSEQKQPGRRGSPGRAVCSVAAATAPTRSRSTRSRCFRIVPEWDEKHAVASHEKATLGFYVSRGIRWRGIARRLEDFASHSTADRCKQATPRVPTNWRLAGIITVGPQRRKSKKGDMVGHPSQLEDLEGQSGGADLPQAPSRTCQNLLEVDRPVHDQRQVRGRSRGGTIQGHRR